LYYDLASSNGVFLINPTAFTSYSSGPTELLTLTIPSNLNSGTYTIRIYGDEIAPSYIQVRILGRNDYHNDFPIYVNSTSNTTTVGSSVTLNLYTAANSANGPISYTVVVTGVDLGNGVSQPSNSVTSSITNEIPIKFTIPSTTPSSVV
jgi:hypothetical protein